MKRFTLILSGVLALQLGLALILTMGGSDFAAYEAEEPMLAFEKDKVDQIAIDESGGGSVTLKKQDGKWIIPSLAEFPADQEQVSRLVDQLAELKKGWPVATSSDAAERFKVTADSHERRIVLKSGDKELASLLIGSSPTYRQAHARLPDDGEIYSVSVASYDAGVRGENWMDRDFLKIPRDKITGISVGDVTLERKDGKVTLADLKAEEKPNEGEIASIVSAVASPSFDVVQGKGKEAAAKVEPADFTVTVKREGGDPVVYKFKKEAEGGAYHFTSSANDYVFRVAEAAVKPFAELKREKLIVVAKKEPAEEPKPPQASDEQKPNDGTGG